MHKDAITPVCQFIVITGDG